MVSRRFRRLSALHLVVLLSGSALACSQNSSGIVAIENGLGVPEPSASTDADLGVVPPGAATDGSAFVSDDADPSLPSGTPGVVASPMSPALGAVQPSDSIPAPMPTAVATTMPTMMSPPPAPKGVNLILNGDFASGNSYWRVDDGLGNVVAPSTATGELCVTVSTTQPFVSIAWPLDPAMGVALQSANVYQLTYDAWTDNPEGVIFEAKIGTATDPPTTHFVVEVGITTFLEGYSHAFNSRSSAVSGVLFEVNQLSDQAQVCIDNVSLKGL